MPDEKTPPADKADDATTEDATAAQLAAVLSDDPETNEAAFASAFDEFAAMDDTTTTTTEPAPVDGPDGDKADAAASTDDDKAASGDDQPDADKDDPPADDKATAAPDSAAEDIWKDATPEQKAAIKAAEHENQSNRNRASAQNRKIAELMAKPAAEQAAKPAAKPEDAESWEKFKEDFPDTADQMEKRFGSRLETLEAENAALKGQVTGIETANTQQAINTEEAVLLKRHPDWQTFTASAEFVAWLPTQPRYVQEGLARNGAAIVDGEEAADLLDRFKDDHAAPETTETPETTAPAEETPKPATDTKTNGKATRRTRRLESAVSTEPGTAGPGAGPPEGDFDAAFKHYAGQP